MRLNKSSNPAFAEKLLEKKGAIATDRSDAMTREGAVNKSIILTLILMASAAFSWQGFVTGVLPPWAMWVGMIGGLVVAFATIFKPQWSAVTAPLYAALEGVFVGMISAVYSHFMDGIVTQAVGLTMGTLFIMLFLYKSGIIKVTKKFRSGVIMATGAIFFLYMISWIVSMFGGSMSFLHDGSTLSIVLSLAIVGVASMNLLLDFDNIEKWADAGAKKYMEWFAGFGLLITLVWLYLEFLRLLSMLQE